MFGNAPARDHAERVRQREAAIEKVLEGRTTVSDIVRVTGQESWARGSSWISTSAKEGLVS